MAVQDQQVSQTPHNTGENLDVRRRKLLFRCWHRGTREMDLLLGRFADENIASLDDAGVAALEKLLEAPDHDLFGWITGGKDVPGNFDLPVLGAIQEFHRVNPVARGS